jgi:preprotein translocase subunit Sec63
MTIDRMVLSFAGFVVLLGLALAYFVNLWWIGLTIFAGLNMLQSGFTGFCPAAMFFKKMGAKPGPAFR